MMLAQNFKKICNDMAKQFENILKNNCFTDFFIVDDDRAIGQVFILEAFYGEEYIGGDNRVIGCKYS